MSLDFRISERKYLDGHSVFHAQCKDGFGEWIEIEPEYGGWITMAAAKTCINSYIARYRARTVEATHIHTFP